MPSPSAAALLGPPSSFSSPAAGARMVRDGALGKRRGGGCAPAHCQNVPLLPSHLFELSYEDMHEARVVCVLLRDERMVAVVAGADDAIEPLAHVAYRVERRENAVHLTMVREGMLAFFA